MQQPAWLARAWAELGVAEIAGRADNPRVLAFYRDAGHPQVQHDEVAWCAAFVGAMLERVGLGSTRSLMARSYLDHGEAIDAFRFGAVAVLTRGSDPALGHVGFLVGESATHLYLLGGNQSDRVSVAAFARERLIELRWPAAAAEEMPAAGEPAAAAADRDGTIFENALAHVLEMEGGWTEDPYDPGGPTNQGVTLAVYARHRGEVLDASSMARLKEELRQIPADVVRDIYCIRYWLPSHAPELPEGLALMHFDAAVNHGVAGAAKLLQQALGVDIDGEIGPLTLAAAQSGREDTSLERYSDIRRARYRSLSHFWRFGRGWLRRVDVTLARSLDRVRTTTGAVNSQTTPKQISKPTEKGPTSMTTNEETVTTSSAKWWGESLTIWGVVVTSLATVLPVVGPFFGFDITTELVHQIGQQATQIAQAVGGLIGTVMTVLGRARATSGLMRREVSVKL